jgi:ABC-type amino acid transport substrate-binding protein
MSGVAVTTKRAAEMLLSAPYLDETLGLLVPDAERDRFAAWRDIARLDGLTVAVANAPYFARQVHALLPRATVHGLDTAADMFDASHSFDAVALPAERGSAWTLLHPQFSMVVPEGALVRIPLAYPVARRDAAWAAFLGTWIDLKRKDGTLQALFEHWIQGRQAEASRPRWSIARDVLHWLP